MGYRVPYLQNTSIKEMKYLNKYKMNQKLIRDTIKRAFLVIQHCGNYRKTTDGYEHKFLDEFSIELRSCIVSLSRMPRYASLVSDVKKYLVKVKKTNFLGSFISWICQCLEFEVITETRKFFESKGFTITAYMFDGLLPARKRKILDPLLLTQCSDHVFNVLHKRFEFTEKPPECQSLAQLFPALQLDYTKPYILFEILKVLGSYQKGVFVPNPGIEHVEKNEGQIQR